jgi:hypothetical protein
MLIIQCGWHYTSNIAFLVRVWHTWIIWQTNKSSRRLTQALFVNGLVRHGKAFVWYWKSGENIICQFHTLTHGYQMRGLLDLKNLSLECFFLLSFCHGGVILRKKYCIALFHVSGREEQFVGVSFFVEKMIINHFLRETTKQNNINI